jgi:hypothetical protein
MKHKLFVLVFLVGCLFSSAQNIQSPEAFLGYKLGSRYTPHFNVVNYFKYAAQTASANIKMQQYGETYEGRPLYVAFVSSAANMANLENIRLANLSRAGMANAAGTSDNTALVWLSYNVHGNETSSSEAAMQTLYELVTKHLGDWLSNTMVIIDPCLNPDGRDRYINWFNGVVGATYNPHPLTREHDEPWPGGRTNHYYFDLNRDWAWQTQTESRSRIKLYNQWMPHVHVDFHEQGYNEPYYFAPAAEPLHDAITPWQRDFQVTIGKNHARYFDKNGWLFFTKERFDLFYPSYGDTWPMYNGAIGMTYEQGGHSAGGLGIINDEGDTLTLADRVAHHTTTGLSTVEISAQNATPLVQAFKKFFDESRNAAGTEYKTFVITSDDEAKINGLKKLLLQNNVSVTRLNGPVAGTGFHYSTGKLENIVLDKYSYAISAYQPKSVLARVLLEPRAKLADSATYDITAWSLPYAHGLKAYATVQRINGEPVTEMNVNAPASVPGTEYALFVPYTSINDAKLLASLLKNGVRVRMNDKPITYRKRRFDRGTLLILKKENAARWNTITGILAASESKIFSVESGFMDGGPDMGSPEVKMIHAPRVGLLTGDGVGSNAVGEVWHLFDRQLQYPVSLFHASEFSGRMLRNIDVLVLADGNYKFLNDKTMLDEVKNWVRGGGRIVAIEYAAQQLAGLDLGLKMKKTDEEAKDDAKKDVYADIKRFENRERDYLVNSIPGAIYRVNLDETHPMAYGYGPEYFSLKQSGDVLEFLKEGGWNVGVVKTNAKLTGFAGTKVTGKIKDGTVMAVQDMGRGAITYIIDNTMFRSFWENGKLLFFNAVFLVGNNPIRL